MPGDSPLFPDCSLQTLRVGHLPRGLRSVFLREAARACGRHLRAGGRLRQIHEDRSHFQDGRLLLLPLPPGPAPRHPIPPEHVISELLWLADTWATLAQTERERLRFVIALSKQLDLSPRLRRTWLRNWLHHRERARARETQLRYRELLSGGYPEKGPPRVRGCWIGRHAATPTTLLRELQAQREQRQSALHLSPRAEVWRCTVLGEDAVVKYFPPPPSPWRQVFAHTRARRAWAGGTLLQEQGLPGPAPLGFVEALHNGCPQESYFVMRMLPGTTTLRRWLVRHWPALSTALRIQLRHRLRDMIQDLHRHGLYHKDVKLLNLLVTPTPNPDALLPGWWIDLEDIRASPTPPVWAIIRNFYQINSSIPSSISREDRLAFAWGFRKRHPLATHRLVLQHVENKTQQRLAREVRSRDVSTSEVRARK